MLSVEAGMVGRTGSRLILIPSDVVMKCLPITYKKLRCLDIEDKYTVYLDTNRKLVLIF